MYKAPSTGLDSVFHIPRVELTQPALSAPLPWPDFQLPQVGLLL